jgi:hypothetical protein
MNNISAFFSKAWRPALLVVSLGLIGYVLYFHNLYGLEPGYAQVEVASYRSALSWRDIAANPLDLPYKAIVYTLNLAGHHSLVITRAAAALCSLLAVTIFFCITRAWYGFRIAFFGAMLFATSAGFLHFARLGSAQVLQMGLLVLIGIMVWHRRAPRLHPYLTYLAALAFGLLCYIPGMIWFELLIVVVMHRRFLRHWKRSSFKHRAAWIALGAATVAPLLVAMALHPHVARVALGLPANIHAISHIPRSLLDTVLAIGVRSNGDPTLWVGHSPLLNVLELVLGGLGAYYYVYRERTTRSLLLAGTLTGGIVLASVGGSVSIACIVPVLYLLVASGLHHFVTEWLTVFPRNPIARGTGLAIVCAMLFFSMFYQMRSYFIAWPHNTQTREVFTVPHA